MADINGDGIPDLLIANQGSNDVSVLFGSYDAAGDWVGTPGPRLKSGGDGPIAVTVRDLNGDGIPDLVVTNGGSGTITMLPGVGQGFFDDQHPQTLFNLGGAVVQPPTFVGDSGVGYAVMAGGDLVRFDLADPGSGAAVVFSGQDVLAAQAEANGQVVVALAGGTVELLAPRGDGLAVVATLAAQAGVPLLPSSLQVLQLPGGPAEVLVSSQGSDTVFVFAQAAGPKGSSSGESAPSGPGEPPVLFTSVEAVVAPTNGAGANSFGVTESAGAAVTSGSSFLSAANGLSLTAYASSDNGNGAWSTASLVAIQGSSYSAVALLDFGSQNDDDPGQGGERKPWLSMSHAFGDTSPLTRFVIGQEEALRQYRAEGGTLLPEDGSDAAGNDPWSEDLFQRSPPSPPPDRTREGDKRIEGGGPGAGQGRRTAPDCFWEKCSGDPLLMPSATLPGDGANIEALAVLLAGMVLAQGKVGYFNRESQERKGGKERKEERKGGREKTAMLELGRPKQTEFPRAAGRAAF